MARLDKWEKEHIKHIAKYEEQVRQIYATAIVEATKIGQMATFDPSRPFSFADFPLTNKLMSDLQKRMAADIEAVITKGVDTEWDLSDAKAKELVESLYGDVESELMELRKRAYLSARDKAREAFKTRKELGLSLSDRVWRYTGQFKEEIEMALDMGLLEGKSADELSREVRKYLNNPDMLFRRVRDKRGMLHLSQRAKAYHPGQGVYRSSYKNARRLTATETNMAYRSADYEHRQALDFVVGIKIQLSNNHTLNGEPFVDICDHLAGNYPKDFKFVGWHPLCRCFTTTILKTQAEIDEDTVRILQGKAPKPASSSKNYVGDTPDQFKAWCRLNAGRVERAKSLPYFIRDNQEYYDAAFKKKALTPLELAEQRRAQRTPEQAQAIRDRWEKRRIFYGNYSPEQLARFKEIEVNLGIKRGMPMSVGKADEQSANPNYGKDYQYSINCQTCAPAYMLRRAGFDVYAKGKTPGSLSDWISRGHSFDIWENANGSPAIPTRYNDWMAQRGYKQMTPQRYKQFFEESCKDSGTYVVTIKWKGGQGAHATIIERFDDGSLWYVEPQSYNTSRGVLRDIMELCNNGAASVVGSRGVMRVDDKLFKLAYLSIFEKY
ncbi:MAG: hypothetical protein J6V00_07700 [Bacteroidaceae bacterium]|nr:hypothetical protein [Bacteroidaceae bacterium]